MRGVSIHGFGGTVEGVMEPILIYVAVTVSLVSCPDVAMVLVSSLL